MAKGERIRSKAIPEDKAIKSAADVLAVKQGASENYGTDADRTAIVEARTKATTDITTKLQDTAKGMLTATDRLATDTKDDLLVKTVTAVRSLMENEEYEVASGLVNDQIAKYDPTGKPFNRATDSVNWSVKDYLSTLKTTLDSLEKVSYQCRSGKADRIRPNIAKGGGRNQP